MRSVFILMVVLFSERCYCQTICKPNIDIKVIVCGSRFVGDSLCPACYECIPRLLSADSNYSIISFKAIAGGEAFNGDIEEVMNTGHFLNNIHLKAIIVRLKPGSFIEFNCIKAKDKSGRLFILQPLFIQL